MKTVFRRACGFSSVRAAITAGTVQPKPSSSGTAARPLSDRRLMNESVIYAARLIYPQSSRNPRQINKINMFGKNVSTAPTPGIIPSVISSASARFTFNTPRSLAASNAIPSADCEIIPSPTLPTENVRKNTAAIMHKNSGIPKCE